LFLKCFNFNINVGYILKDFEQKADDILIPDKLKEALVMEESEYYEFLFHVFKRIVLGGSLCQWEDYVTEYFRMTKLFYKGNITI